MKNLLIELQKRGLIFQTSEFSHSLNGEHKLTFYCGFDPTSDSLHLGSLLPLLTMRRFQSAGHKPILLIGGATAMIGDPSGKSKERILLSKDVVENNIEGIKKIASMFLSFDGINSCEIVNNYDWFQNMNMLEFLRDIGKHFSVNWMIGKDSVRSRLEDHDLGISFTELTYMILQGYDFYFLNKIKSCTLQIGGSDQWGNMTAGLELIRRKGVSSNCFIMTLPLVIKADGKKFGKSESGNIWLDPKKTSPYILYQFLLQTSDQDIERYLKFFSFKTLDEISDVMVKHQSQPGLRLAQDILASEIVDLCHGPEERKKVKKASQALFTGDLKSLDVNILNEVFKDVPSISFSMTEINSGLLLIDLLVRTGLSISKSTARKDIESGGIYMNDNRIEDVKKVVFREDFLFNHNLVLRKGKKNYFLIKFF